MFNRSDQWVKKCKKKTPQDGNDPTAEALQVLVSFGFHSEGSTNTKDLFTWDDVGCFDSLWPTLHIFLFLDI